MHAGHVTVQGHLRGCPRREWQGDAHTRFLCVRVCIYVGGEDVAPPPLFLSSFTDAYSTSLPHSSMDRLKRYVQLLRCSPRNEFKPELPPKPHSICEFCWEGPFAAQLGSFHCRGYSYRVWRSQITQGASSGCLWCGLLLEKVSSLSRFSKRAKLECHWVTACIMGEVSSYTLIKAQVLSVSVNGIYFRKVITTSSSECSNHTQGT